MKVPSRWSVGVASHTGGVRANNEDDYLLGALAQDGTLLAAIADGMGGLAGGAEASRTALRALGVTVLDGGSRAPLAERLRDGFAAAGVRVHDAALAVPALRDMGTTLTALCLHGDHALVGHIGDTRLYRLRGGECLQLTEDHSRRDGGNLLTRCVGAGSAACEADHQQFATAPGDRYVLATDGVWGVLSAAELQRCVTRGEPQAVAERLIAAALAAGGPDNATAVVVDVVGVAAGQREQELPRNERADDRGAWPRAIPLRPPLWPWLLLAAAAVVAVLAGLDWAGVDPWAAFG